MQSTDRATHRNRRRQPFARFVHAAVCVSLCGAAHAVDFQVSKKGINFSLSVTELVGSPAGGRRVDLGVKGLKVTGRVVATPMEALAKNPVAERVVKSVNDAVFVAVFANREASCASSPSIKGGVVDRYGNRDRITTPKSAQQYVRLSFTPFELRRQCRGNGSLHRIWYGGDFVISGMDTAATATNFEGTLTLDVSFP